MPYFTTNNYMQLYKIVFIYLLVILFIQECMYEFYKVCFYQPMLK